MVAAGKVGERVEGRNRDRPPPKIFLGIGATCLALNHLSVAVGNGVQAEALMMGCWLVMMGGWLLVAGRSFDVIWEWANRPRRSQWCAIGVAVLTLFAALGIAEAVAWYGYGQRLLG